MAGIEEICRVREVDLLFAAMPVDDEYYPLGVPTWSPSGPGDGLIVIGAHLSHGTTVLLEDGPPAILVDAYAEDVAFDSVVSDNVGGARAAIEHLIENGHREIASVGESLPGSRSRSILQRRRGYEQAIAEVGSGRDTSRSPRSARGGRGRGHPVHRRAPGGDGPRSAVTTMSRSG